MVQLPERETARRFCNLSPKVIDGSLKHLLQKFSPHSGHHLQAHPARLWASAPRTRRRCRIRPLSLGDCSVAPPRCSQKGASIFQTIGCHVEHTVLTYAFTCRRPLCSLTWYRLPWRETWSSRTYRPWNLQIVSLSPFVRLEKSD